ncbi:MAG: metallophosphoesterase [Candidatus Methanoliparum thermophilum]|uniref:Metallophosphoesterase n=1 Tax=Methanoliparum thermophilum TaxID=2491083 RepID=A0A520KT24_METT2|nr:metallophosphoesterase [Candidatus Methanoliparum sp. LAM-1]RZN65077.1 MAG: metallophosphoesterase [Candidatus Methanoliparum thermophilum]
MPIKIIHLSDIHIASPYFIPDMYDDVVREINDIEPDIVVITGDLTNEGRLSEYEEASRYIKKIKCKNMVILPGNHDTRNAGYLLFEEYFGERIKTLRYKNITVVGVDSSEPDIDDGHIGRDKYPYIIDSFNQNKDDFKIFALHHHVIPVPLCGRERNVPTDAGDLLDVLDRLKIDMILCGHRHVPWLWNLNDMIVLNAGTASTSRTKGKISQSYNYIEIDDFLKIYRISSNGEKYILLNRKIYKDEL